MSNVVHTFYLLESVSVLYTDYVADAMSYMWLKSVEISSPDSRVCKVFIKSCTDTETIKVPIEWLTYRMTHISKPIV